MAILLGSTALAGAVTVLPEGPLTLSAYPSGWGAKLSWTPVASAEYYTIYYHTMSDVIGNPIAESVPVSGMVTSYELSELDYGTTYYIIVEAERSSGETVHSNVVSMMPDSTSVDSLQLTGLTEMIDTLEGDKTALQATIDTLNDQIDALQDEVDSLTSGNANLAQQIDALNQSVTDLQTQINNLNASIADLQQENEQLKQDKLLWLRNSRAQHPGNPLNRYSRIKSIR